MKTILQFYMPDSLKLGKLSVLDVRSRHGRKDWKEIHSKNRGVFTV